MAAIFFHSIEEFKSFDTTPENDEAFLESIESDVKFAFQTHIAPWVGSQLSNYMIYTYPDFEKDTEIELLERIQAALAPLALYHASKTKNVKFSVNGIERSEKTAYRYQENEMREELLLRGYENIELMIKYLDEKDFENWGAKEKHRSLYLAFAADFRDAAPYNISRYTYEALRSIIEDVEYTIIQKILPSRFFEYLRDRIAPMLTESGETWTTESGETWTVSIELSEKEKKVKTLLYRVIANLTVAEAMQRQRVQIEGNSIVIRTYSADQIAPTRTIAPSAAIDRTYTFANLASDKNVERLKTFISKNKSHFPSCYHTSAGGTNPDDDAWGRIDENATTEKATKICRL